MSKPVIRMRPEIDTKLEQPPQLLKISEIPTGQAVLKMPRRTTNLNSISGAGYHKCFFIASTQRSARQIFGGDYAELKELAEPVLERARVMFPLLSKHISLGVDLNVNFGSWGYGTKPSYFYAADLAHLVRQLQQVNFDHIPLRSFILPNDECQWIVFNPRGDSYTATQFGQKMYDEIPQDNLMGMIESDTRLANLGSYVCAMKTATYKGITCEPIKTRG